MIRTQAERDTFDDLISGLTDLAGHAMAMGVVALLLQAADDNVDGETSVIVSTSDTTLEIVLRDDRGPYRGVKATRLAPGAPDRCLELITRHGAAIGAVLLTAPAVEAVA